MWDSFQTSAIIAKNLFFICFWNPNCVRKNVPVYMSVYAGHDSRTQGKSYFGHLIFQKYICAHLKCYIFHFNTSQINFISNWALNWPWALEFEHHWGMGARIVRGTKCSVYNTGWSEKGCGRAKLSSQTSLIIKSAIIKIRPISRNSIKKNCTLQMTCIILMYGWGWSTGGSTLESGWSQDHPGLEKKSLLYINFKIFIIFLP